MSLAWCPSCEILTNDVSTPCHKCGGPLEYATLQPNPQSHRRDRRMNEQDKLIEKAQNLFRYVMKHRKWPTTFGIGDYLDHISGLLVIVKFLHEENERLGKQVKRLLDKNNNYRKEITALSDQEKET